jgi:hypothetical protein
MRPPFRRPSVQPARETYVTIHEHRGPRRFGAIRKPSVEELAAERRLGLALREEWRAEKADQTETVIGSAAGASKPARRAGKSARAASFAEGIARAEFGRFYWNGRLERALDATRKRGPTDQKKKRR